MLTSLSNLKPVLRTAMRFDVGCGDHFSTCVFFPCVRAHGKPGAEASLWEIRYASGPSEGRKYRRFPLGDGRVWHIDKVLCNDNETEKSVISSLNVAKAAPGCYLSSNFPETIPLKGCSLGLAVVAVVLGMNGRYAFTGWMSGYGMDSKFDVGPVQGTELKIEYCRKHDIPIFVAAATLESDPTTSNKSALHRFYSFADYLAGVPFSTAIHEAVECATMADVVVMWQAISLQRKCEANKVTESHADPSEAKRRRIE